MNILFSIIVPTFNRPHLLKRALYSIIQQTYHNWEVIVVNDGSAIDYDSDFTSISSRILYFYKENTGLPSSRNFGISKAKGNYICFLDDDDEYLPNHLMVLSKLIENNPDAGLYRTLTKISKEGELKLQDFDQRNSGNTIQHILKNMLTVNNVCIPKKVFQQFRFDPSIPIAEDYDLWIRLALQYKFVHSEEYTTIYFIGSSTMSSGSIEQYKKYIAVYSYILSHPSVSIFISKKEIEVILLKYYKFSLYIHSKKGDIVNLLKTSLEAFKISSSYIFCKEPYALVIKTLLKK